MPAQKRNRILTSLEAFFEASERTLQRNLRDAVEEGTAALTEELRELRKALLRLQEVVAQSGGTALATPAPRAPRRAVKLCAVEGCGRKHAAKGLCKNHYQQWLNRKKKEGPNAPKPGAPRRSRTIKRRPRGRGR